MDFIVKRIWWITIPTALAVSAFQLYWLISVYRTQQQNFLQVSSDALQKAYDQTMSDAVMSMLSSKNVHGNVTANSNLSSGKAGISSSIVIEASDADSFYAGKKKKSTVTVHSGDEDQSFPGKDTLLVKKDVDLNTVGIDPQHILTAIFAEGNMVKPDTSRLRFHFTAQLQARKISIPFSIIKGKNISADPSVIAVSTDKVNIAVRFSGLSKWLFIKMLWPIILSFLLVVLIIFCIWILWRIILRQKKLEVMKNDFISNITHELKTPVSILSATNETLLHFGGMHDPEKTERYLRLEHEELKKLQSLLDRIILLTRLEHHVPPAAHVTPIALHTWLPETLSRFINLPGTTLHLENHMKDPLIYSQEAFLETIIINLVDNGIKYSGDKEKWVAVRLYDNGDDIRIEVEDHGIGIEKSRLAFIFDKFYRVPNGNVHDIKGYGLGLSHVKSILAELGGRIEVKSESGRGSLFTVFFKRA